MVEAKRNRGRRRSCADSFHKPDDWGQTDRHTHTAHSNGDKAAEKVLCEKWAGFSPEKQQCSQASAARVSVEKGSHWRPQRKEHEHSPAPALSLPVLSLHLPGPRV